MSVKIMGYNAPAILVAAIAIYAVGFVIYALLLTPEAWMASAGITKEQMDAVGVTRLPYSPALPIATALGMAILFRWAGVTGLAQGIQYGALIALLSAVPAIWYGWVYGVDPAAGSLIDSVHLLAGHIVAGAILGSWK